MESAIPEHLRSARTRHRRVPDDYAPPYPSFVARHKPSVNRVVMAYFGIQTRGAPSNAALQALAWITSCFGSNGGPTHWDRAQYVDEAGFTNVVTVAYWDDRATFDGWFPPVRDGWTGEQRKLVARLRSLIARFEDTRDLRLMGGYTPGADPILDQAVSIVPRVYEAMTQAVSAPPTEDAFQDLATALKGEVKPEKAAKGAPP